MAAPAKGEERQRREREGEKKRERGKEGKRKRGREGKRAKERRERREGREKRKKGTKRGREKREGEKTRGRQKEELGAPTKNVHASLALDPICEANYKKAACATAGHAPPDHAVRRAFICIIASHHITT